MRMNIKTQIKDISKRCKDKFNNMIENTHYKIDCILYYNRYHKFYKGTHSIWTILGDKVSLATAWLGKKVNRVDISKASMGYSDCYIHNTDIQEQNKDLRRKQLNS
jgi:hypothetical protein